MCRVYRMLLKLPGAGGQDHKCVQRFGWEA